MSKIFVISVLFLMLISFASSIGSCGGLGSDCDLFTHCCDGLRCKDYRCAIKGTKENQVEWAPDGPKCDYFHWCKSDYHCVQHRCVIKRQTIIDNITKKLNKKNKKK